jgi:hypothetical protein
MFTSKNDLFDRYLHAVRFWLPKAQQQDILAELAEDLRSQIEDREAALGHQLSDDEVAALLKQRGSPMTVASGYLPEVRLIDPAMVPLYRVVLKIVLLWVLAPLFVIVFIGPLLASPYPQRVIALACVEGFRACFTAVGIITTVFVLLRRFHLGVDKWDPRKLPRVPAAYQTSARWNHLAAFIFGALAVMFWMYFMWNRTEFAIPDGPRILLSPVWKQVNWILVVFTMLSALSDLLAALRPAQARVRSWIHLGVDACWLVMVAIWLRVDNWVTIVAPKLSARDQAALTTWKNLSIEITLASVAVVIMLDAFFEIRRLRRARLPQSAPVLTAS